MATTTPTDHKVPHISTVPANAGQNVKLHVREYDGTPSGPNAQRKVVLMLHGRSVPSAVAFDLQHDGGKYSWAQHLAKAGFDVFLMELTGSGLSPRPEMDKPCNANPQHQEILDPNPLTYTCTPPYPHELGNSESEWGEVDAVVEYIKAKKGVTKVALVGQSAAAFVFGPYAIQHSEKVESLLLLAPIYPPAGRASAPPKSFGAPVASFPVSTPASLFGFPMNLSSRTGLESAWDKEVRSPSSGRRAWSTRSGRSSWPSTPSARPGAARRPGRPRACCGSATPTGGAGTRTPSRSAVCSATRCR